MTIRAKQLDGDTRSIDLLERETGLTPKIVRGEKLYDLREVNQYAVKQINNGNDFLNKRSKRMANEVDLASEKLEKSIDAFGQLFDKLEKTEVRFAESIKKSGGKLRQETTNMSAALQKLEKSADFNRLEKYVSIIERAADAMERMHELQKTGALEKITSALK